MRKTLYIGTLHIYWDLVSMLPHKLCLSSFVWLEIVWCVLSFRLWQLLALREKGLRFHTIWILKWLQWLSVAGPSEFKVLIFLCICTKFPWLPIFINKWFCSEPWKRPSFATVMESLRPLIKPPTPQPGRADMTLLTWRGGRLCLIHAHNTAFLWDLMSDMQYKLFRLSQVRLKLQLLVTNI